MVKVKHPTYKIVLKRMAQFVLISLSAVLLALISVFGLWQLDSVKDWASKKVLEIAQESLTEPLSIGKLDGTLYSNLTLSKIVLGDAISIDSVRLEYNFFGLITPPFTVDRLLIVKPNVRISQDSDSVFSFVKLIKPDTSSVEIDSTSASFPFLINTLELENGSLLAQLPFLLPYDSLFFNPISIQTRISMDDDGFMVDLNKLDFAVFEPILKDTLRLSLDAKASNNAISIGKLLLESTKSKLELQADLAQDSSKSEIKGKLNVPKLAWQDIRALEQKSPLKEDVTLDIQFHSKQNVYSVRLSASSKSMESLQAEIGFSFQNQLSIKSVSVQGKAIDFAALLQQKTRMNVRAFNFYGEGLIPIKDYKNSFFELNGTVESARYDSQFLQVLSFATKLNQKNVTGSLHISQYKSQITGQFSLNDIFDEFNWATSFSLSQVNIKAFDANLPISTLLNGTLKANGKGKEFKITPEMNLFFELNKSRIADTKIELSRMDLLTHDSLSTFAWELQLQKSRMNTLARISFAKEEPTYTFSTQSANFNIAEIKSLSFIPTHLHFNFKGEGTGFNIETMFLQASANMDSSIISGGFVDSLRGKLTLKNARLYAENFKMQSDFADGTLQGNGSILDFFAKDNSIIIDLSLKKLDRLAPLFGLKHLSAIGDLKAEIKPRKKHLLLTGNMDFESIRFDSIFVEQIQGNIEAQIRDTSTYTVDLHVESPAYKELSFRDFNLKSSGTIFDNSINGILNLDLGIKVSNAIRFQTSFKTAIEKDSTFSVMGEIDQIIFESIRREFLLKEPTNWHYSTNTFYLDSLIIQSTDNAYLRLFVDAKADTQRYDVKMNELDLSAAYGTLVKATPSQSLASGHIYLKKSASDIQLDSDFEIKPLRYDRINIDSIRISTTIRNQILVNTTNAFIGEKPLIKLHAELPFSYYDSAQSVKKPIKVNLSLNRFNLEPYSDFIDSLGFGKVRGSILGGMELSGTLEQPKWNTFLDIDSLLIGGVLLDSMRSKSIYNPNTKRLDISGEVYSLSKKVASIDGFFPMYLNLTDLSTVKPKDNVPFVIRAKTDGFELNSLNDFLDNTQYNRLAGVLDLDIGLKGTFSDLSLDGFLRLEKGKIELMKHGIILRDLHTEIQLDKKRIQVKSFDVKSNSGNANAIGFLETDDKGIAKTDVKIHLSNFQISDTRNFKAQISSDISLSGARTTYAIKGKISAKRTDVFLENFGEKKVEEIHLETETLNYELIEELYKNLTAQMKIVIERDVWVKNREYPELNVELFGTSDLIKNKNEDFQLFGVFETRRGYAKQFSKKFVLDKGEITFSGDPTNPRLNIETSYTLRSPRDVKIEYIIGGTAKEPTFTYKSDPKMELEDIVSYTLFGKPFAALMGWQQGITGNSTGGGSVSDLAVGILLDRVESYATEKFGIDVIEIDNSASTTGTGTSIRAGKYINERTFVALVQQLGGTDAVSQVVLEYMLRKNLELILTQSSDDRSGLDLRWRYKY